MFTVPRHRRCGKIVLAFLCSYETMQVASNELISEFWFHILSKFEKVRACLKLSLLWVL